MAKQIGTRIMEMGVPVLLTVEEIVNLLKILDRVDIKGREAFALVMLSQKLQAAIPQEGAEFTPQEIASVMEAGDQALAETVDETPSADA